MRAHRCTNTLRSLSDIPDWHSQAVVNGSSPLHTNRSLDGFRRAQLTVRPTWTGNKTRGGVSPKLWPKASMRVSQASSGCTYDPPVRWSVRTESVERSRSMSSTQPTRVAKPTEVAPGERPVNPPSKPTSPERNLDDDPTDEPRGHTVVIDDELTAKFPDDAPPKASPASSGPRCRIDRNGPGSAVASFRSRLRHHRLPHLVELTSSRSRERWYGYDCHARQRSRYGEKQQAAEASSSAKFPVVTLLNSHAPYAGEGASREAGSSGPCVRDVHALD
ncbi:hypothetical protein NUW54_g12563 [Trametes sanguinea]|uniref:Uncharacterized protein n=1 Tax=Trametes sanguinea TaxID=158606 RepID=A0ACC1MY24_9APHY|nr:hypothetical protein NUW54_g12563 [Trametes sanguinea]